MSELPEQRPAPSPALSSTEFDRWYWRKDELVALARDLGLRPSGGKDLLTRRISASLAGREFSEPAPAGRRGARLSGELSATTLIPPGQNCSQVVRAWFVARVGPGFGFDAAMRAFFAGADGTTTMQDALDHWHATRDRGPREIDAQFEFNRFTRAWHQRHPGGDRAALLADWQVYRTTPIDRRGRA